MLSFFKYIALIVFSAANEETTITQLVIKCPLRQNKYYSPAIAMLVIDKEDVSIGQIVIDRENHPW